MVESLQLQVGRQGRTDLLEIPLHFIRQDEGVVRRRALGVQLDGAVQAAPVGPPVAVESLAHDRNVAQQDFLTARQRLDLDPAEFAGRSDVANAAQLALRPACDVAGRNILCDLADFLCHVVQRKAEAAQRFRLDFDQYLLVAPAADVDLVDSPPEQTVPDLLGVDLERGFGIGPGHQNARQGIVADEPPDRRRLGVLRQGGHLRDGRFDVRQRALHVRARLEFHRDRGPPLERRRFHRLHAVDEADLPFDRLNDVAVDIAGAGAGPRDGNQDNIDPEIGKELRGHPVEAEEPGDQHQHHQQVRRRAMAREQTDRIVLPTNIPRPVSGVGPGAAGLFRTVFRIAHRSGLTGYCGRRQRAR